MKAGSFLHEKAAEGISAPSIEETTGHSAPDPHLEHSAGPTGPRTPADAELLETSSLGETQPLSLHFWPSHGLFGKSPVATNGG